MFSIYNDMPTEVCGCGLTRAWVGETIDNAPDFIRLCFLAKLITTKANYDRKTIAICGNFLPNEKEFYEQMGCYCQEYLSSREDRSL